MTGVPVIPVTGSMFPHGSVSDLDGRAEVGPPDDAPVVRAQGVHRVVLGRDEHLASVDERLRVYGAVEGRRVPVARHRREVGDLLISRPGVVAVICRPILREGSAGGRARALGARRYAGVQGDSGGGPVRVALEGRHPSQVDRPDEDQQDGHRGRHHQLLRMRSGRRRRDLAFGAGRKALRRSRPLRAVVMFRPGGGGRRMIQGIDREVQGEGRDQPGEGHDRPGARAPAEVRGGDEEAPGGDGDLRRGRRKILPGRGEAETGPGGAASGRVGRRRAGDEGEA